MVWSEALQELHVFQEETCANRCSLCNAYAPTLTLSSFSVTHNSGSLLFLPHYFGKQITALGKRREKKPFYNCQGGQNCSKLNSSEHFENSHQKTSREETRGRRSWFRNHLWGYETLRKRHSSNLHEGERYIGPHIVVLPVLLAPSALCQSLPRGASSFFPWCV